MEAQQNQNLTTGKSKSTGSASSMQTCIDNCTECHQICVRTITHCLERGGAHADPKHIQILQDCTRICEVSASFMIRQSGYHSLICEACAKICLACAESCDAFDNDAGMNTPKNIDNLKRIDKMKHISPSTYKNLLALAQIADLKTFMMTEALMSEAQATRVVATVQKLSQKFQQDCQSGKLLVDLDINAVMNNTATLDFSESQCP